MGYHPTWLLSTGQGKEDPEMMCVEDVAALGNDKVGAMDRDGWRYHQPSNY